MKAAALAVALICAGGIRAAEVSVCDALWHDSTRNRDIPVRIRMPDTGGQAVPVILFSHGLGGTLDAGTEWAKHWAEGGFAVIHLQHAGSDAALIKGARSAAERVAALKTGMDARQLIARVADVSFVLDELGRRRTEGRCDLTRIDRRRIGMSGHSFGAQTTQAIAGQVYPTGATLRDRRVVAAVAFSPAPPKTGIDNAFSKIAMPFLSLTGTEDTVPALRNTTAEERVLPFQRMPAGGKYLLVFEGADHADFSGNKERNRKQHVSDVVRQTTLMFWRSTLLGDNEATNWLKTGQVRSLLHTGDRFESK